MQKDPCKGCIYTFDIKDEYCQNCCDEYMDKLYYIGFIPEEKRDAERNRLS
jgi:hypothetical protein